MNKKDLDTIFEFYELSNQLTTLLRKGWVYYNLESDRVESVAEHIFSTCMLGFAIYSAESVNIDIARTMMMILLHETEECFIGDITPVDANYKLYSEEARKLIIKLFSKFKNPRCMQGLIEEFDGGESDEAKFARQCDKLQSDFQARLYEGKFNLNKSNSPLLIEEQKLLCTKAIDGKIYKLFIHNHESKYSGIFSELANYLKADDKIFSQQNNSINK